MPYSVYKHTAPNGKVYIGITRKRPEKRWLNGKGYPNNYHFSNAIMFYGWANIKHDILLSGLTKAEAQEAEIKFIALYESMNPDKGYNLTRGGDGNWGHVPSSEAKRKTSQTLSEFYRNNPHHSRGIRLSDEHRCKVSQALKGIRRTEATRRNMSRAQRGRNITPEATEKRLATNRERYPDWADWRKVRVMCIDTGEIFDTIKDACDKYGLSKGNVCMCCRGQRKKTGGLRWTYAPKEGDTAV
jgi:group I intron endonuclease